MRTGQMLGRLLALMVIGYGSQVPGAGTIWTDLEEVGNGWKRSAWFGLFHGETAGPGWIYHLSHGWVWVQGPSEDQCWLHLRAAGWGWTAPEEYPILYLAETGSWVAYAAAGDSFTPLAYAEVPAAVVATEPADAATGVDTGLSQIRITFNQPMDGAASWEVDSQWGSSYAVWTADKRTVELHRLNASTALNPASALEFTLNPNGKGFRAVQGGILGPYTFGFTVAQSGGSGAYVDWSYPANNARDVDPLLDTVTLHFTEPMYPTGGLQSSNWWPWTLAWSSDQQTCTIQRGSAGTPLYSTDVLLKTILFRTAAGQSFEPGFTLQFRTAAPAAIRVEANPAKGFFWPYFLVLPQQMRSPGTLLVEPNNTGTTSDDPWVHEAAALNIIAHRATFANELQTPLLVPVFPRPRWPEAPNPGGIYVHALDRYSLSHSWNGIERVDLQMVAMIDDALERLRNMGHSMNSKVFMMGFSASGAFTSRFALLHPERVKAAAPGSPGGWPLAPVAEWQGVPLKYAVGIQDVEALTGTAFNLQAFRQVPLFIYVGDQDTNDAIDLRGVPQSEQSQFYALISFPQDPFLANRWPIAEAIYDSVNANARFVVYPGVAHSISSQMYADILAFFKEHW